MNLTIFPVLFIIYMAATWTWDFLNVGKPTRLNFTKSSFFQIVAIFLLVGCGFFHAFHWPQITWLILSMIGMVILLKRHGEDETFTVANHLVSLAIMIFIYIKGGAFQYLSN